MKKLIIVLFGCALLLVGNSCVVHSRPAQSNVVVVKKAPKYHKVVVVKGKRYYTWGGKHYRKTRKGFVYVRI